MGVVRGFSVLLSAGLLSGCAGLSGIGDRLADSGPDFGTPPIVSDRFLLAEGQQVVGALLNRHMNAFRIQRIHGVELIQGIRKQ